MPILETQRLILAAGTALLDRIGPAVLMTHSQSGTFGWLLADSRPALVKAVVALAPADLNFLDEVLTRLVPAMANVPTPNGD